MDISSLKQNFRTDNKFENLIGQIDGKMTSAEKQESS